MHKVGNMIGALTALFLVQVTSVRAETWTKTPLRFETQENMVTDGGIFRLRREYRQAGNAAIVFEAEEATRLELNGADQRIMKAAGTSGGGYVHFVKMLEFDFEAETAGRYHVWERVWFPLPVAAYSHSERMDDGETHSVKDSPRTMAEVWYWTKGVTYDLAKGRHRFLFPSPTAFCAGARLDKLVLQPADQAWAPEDKDLGPPASPLTTPEKGMAVSRRIQLKLITAWRLDFEAEPNGGTATVEYSYDFGKTWTSATAGAVQTVQDPKPRYVLFRFCLSGKAGQPSPWLQGVQLSIVKSATIMPQEDPPLP